MEKLQTMLDKAFGSIKTFREPERPSEAFLARERAFQERASKIEKLRQVRLADGGTTTSTSTLVFEVVRHRGHWRTFHRSKYSTPFASQAAAIQAAKELARKKRDLGQSVEVLLRRTDGQIVPQSVEDENA